MYDQCDYAALNQAISITDREFLNEGTDIESISQKFIFKLNNLFREYIPTKKFILRPFDRCWMNSDIRRQQRRPNHMHCKAKSLNTPEAWARYRTQRNYLNSLIRQQKRDHDRAIVDKLNSLDRSNADWWKVVRTLFDCTSVRGSGRHLLCE